MSDDLLFENEEKIIRYGENLFQYHADTAWPEEYSQLLKSYKKLLHQFRQVIRISDKQQKKISATSQFLEQILNKTSSDLEKAELEYMRLYLRDLDKD